MSKESPEILVVDDSRTMIHILAFNMNRAGFRVETANNGAIALEKLALKPYDAIVTDIQMPVMDGIELCRVVREVRGDTTTPIFLCSGKGLEIDADEMHSRFQISQVFFKPVSPKEIVLALIHTVSAAYPNLCLATHD